MEPVFLLFWATVAMLGGFLLAYTTRWHVGTALTVLASFVAVGLLLGLPLGNPSAPPVIALALTVGLARGASYWRPRLISAENPAVYYFRDGNHRTWEPLQYRRRPGWRTTLARWGFPTADQMAWDKAVAEAQKNHRRHR